MRRSLPNLDLSDPGFSTPGACNAGARMAVMDRDGLGLKAGLRGRARAVAVDHGADGIRCKAVAPGWIDTPLNEDFIESMEDPAMFQYQIGGIHPVRRTCRPDEVARLICLLATDEAGFVTGQIHTIDGGRTARLALP